VFILVISQLDNTLAAGRTLGRDFCLGCKA
jgi:hypothetical protein